MGILISQYTDPYKPKPTSIMESRRVFFVAQFVMKDRSDFFELEKTHKNQGILVPNDLRGVLRGDLRWGFLGVRMSFFR